MLIDTHCHLTYPELGTQLDALVQRAEAAGVTRMLTVATTPADAARAVAALGAHPQIDLIVGIHPHEAGKVGRDELDALRAWHQGEVPLGAAAGRIRAVGETGLDFHYDFAPRPRQEEVFCRQLELAEEVQRPVVIHARNAEVRVCEILTDHPALAGRVVFHCFSGDVELARRILDLGCFLSFTGVVTFRNAETARAAAKFVPADRIMVETDAPYLSPEPVRKIRPCEPAFVAHTARYLAGLRGVSFEDFAATTTANAVRFFALPRVNQ